MGRAASQGRAKGLNTRNDISIATNDLNTVGITGQAP